MDYVSTSGTTSLKTLRERFSGMCCILSDLLRSTISVAYLCLRLANTGDLFLSIDRLVLRRPHSPMLVPCHRRKPLSFHPPPPPPAPLLHTSPNALATPSQSIQYVVQSAPALVDDQGAVSIRISKLCKILHLRWYMYRSLFAPGCIGPCRICIALRDSVYLDGRSSRGLQCIGMRVAWYWLVRLFKNRIWIWMMLDGFAFGCFGWE